MYDETWVIDLGRLMLTSDEHWLNAELPIDFNDSGRLIFNNEEQR